MLSNDENALRPRIFSISRGEVTWKQDPTLHIAGVAKPALCMRVAT